MVGIYAYALLNDGTKSKPLGEEGHRATIY